MHALRLTGAQHWVLDLNHEFGIRDGLYCPFRRWVLLFYAESILKLERSERHLLAMAAGVAVEQIERIVKRPRPPRIPLLTERELAVLRLRAKGNRVPEIARCLGISETTVRTHVQKLTAKLGANDLTHAVAQAFRAGLIV
jgi:DNA-binding NarL/FixJ family response regulator